MSWLTWKARGKAAAESVSVEMDAGQGGWNPWFSQTCLSLENGSRRGKCTICGDIGSPSPSVDVCVLSQLPYKAGMRHFDSGCGNCRCFPTRELSSVWEGGCRAFDCRLPLPRSLRPSAEGGGGGNSQTASQLLCVAGSMLPVSHIVVALCFSCAKKFKHIQCPLYLLSCPLPLHLSLSLSLSFSLSLSLPSYVSSLTPCLHLSIQHPSLLCVGRGHLQVFASSTDTVLLHCLCLLLHRWISGRGPWSTPTVSFTRCSSS